MTSIPSPLGAPSVAHILVVDDLEANLLAMRAVLEPLAQHVVTARSGDAALRALLEFDFAVILLDLRMPDVSGLELASAVRRRARSRATPIILLTAGTLEESEVARAYDSGVVDFLSKPVAPEVIRSKVRAFLALHREREELKRRERALREQEAQQRRNAEAARREAEERLVAVVDNAPVVLFTLDASGVFTRALGRGFEALGIAPADVIGTSIFGLFHGDAPMLGSARRALAGEELQSVDRVSELRIVSSRPRGRSWVSASPPPRTSTPPALLETLETHAVRPTSGSPQPGAQGDGGRALDARRVPAVAPTAPAPAAPELWWETRWAPLRTAEGVLAGTIAVATDVTTRVRVERQRDELLASTRRAHAAAETAHARLHALFMQAPIAIAMRRGPDHVFELANEKYVALNGGRDVLGRKYRDAFPELVDQGVVDLSERVVATGVPHHAEESRLRLASASGAYEERWVNAAILPMMDADGVIDGTVSFVVDVTPQVLARRRLEAIAEERESHQRWLESVLNSAPTPLLLIEPETARVTFANEAMARLVGGDFPMARGAEDYESLYPSTSPDGGPLTNEEMPGVRAARGERLSGLEMGWKTPAGIRSFLVDSASVPALGEHEARAVVSFTDVTKLKDVEGKLKSAVAVRDEFLSIASHELLTPLTSMRLRLQNLARAIARRPTPSAFDEDQIAGMERGLDRLQRLVHDLLDVSRVQRGGLELELSVFDLAELAGEVVARFAPELQKAGCAVTLEAPEPVVGEWDRERVDQVLSNLLSNAVKYGRGAPVEVIVTQDRARARLVVRDHGVGIAPGDQERIFQRFERAVSSRSFGGLGLGLWIVAQIVGALDGAVSVRSAPGDTAFAVALPIRPRRLGGA